MARSRSQQLLEAASAWDISATQSAMLRFEALQAHLQEGAERLAKAQTAVGLAYAASTASLLGWVRAGLAGTVQGNYLQFQMKQLSMQITNLFLPAIEKFTDRITTLVEWFRRLSGEQQIAIARWTAFAVGLLGAATVLPKLIGGFGLLKNVLVAGVSGSPLTMLTAGIVGLMSVTEGGREGLERLGKSFQDAFGPSILFLVNTLASALDTIAEALSTVEGQVAAFGLIFVLAIPRMIAGVQALGLAFLSLRGAIGLALGALTLLIGLMGKSTFGKMLDELSAQVRSGRTSLKDAEEEVRRAAAEEAYKSSETVEKRSLVPFLRGLGIGGSAEEMEETERKRLEEEGLARVRGATKDRSEGVLARSGTETDPRQTIRRLEEAVLKAQKDDAGKRTADGVEAIKRIAESLLRGLLGKDKQDNRDNQAKAD